MSFKSELQSVVTVYQNNLNSAIKQINETAEGGNYTPQGLENRVREINAEFQATAEIYQERGLQIISQAEEYLKSKNQENTVNNLRDPGYQAGLVNVLKMIEKGILSEDDFKNVIAAYKDDALSMKSIRMALPMGKENGAVLSQYIPPSLEDNLEVFEKLRKNVRKFIRPVSANNNYGVLMSVGWLQEALKNLDDNLRLVE